MNLLRNQNKMKKIWIICNKNMPPELGHYNRHYNFAKNLHRMGWEPTVFVASYLHNTDRQMINDKSLFLRYEGSEFPYYFIKTRAYGSSRINRVWAMLDCLKNLPSCVDGLEPPDYILGSSSDPVNIYLAIKLAKKYNCKCIGEVRDLWPESFVAYGIVGKKNPLLKLLYAGERWLYKKADKMIFTMEGGRDYIIDKGWDTEHGGPIDINKVYHINNGIDLEMFDYNREHYTLDDEDLNNPDTFKVIYAGSIRMANKIGMLVEAAEKLRDHQEIVFLIYGDGTEREELERYCKSKRLDNVKFKGHIEKKYIPNVLSKGDLNTISGSDSVLMKYGWSLNKIFDHLASGKPMLTTFGLRYSLFDHFACGKSVSISGADTYAKEILSFKELDSTERQRMCEEARRGAQAYDFKVLTEKLIGVLEG